MRAAFVATDPALSPLVGRLYEDAASGRGLAGGLAAAVDIFGANCAHLVASDPASGVPRWAHMADAFGGELLDAARRYDGDLFRADPRRTPGMARLARNGAWRCQEFIGEREVSRSAFFQDFFLPISFRYSMVARLPIQTAVALAGSTGPAAPEFVDLAIVRGPDQGHFDDTSFARLRGLVPHLHTALALQRQTDALKAGTLALGAAATDALVIDGQRGIAAATPGATAQVGSVFGRLVFGRGAHRRGQPQVDAALADTRADGLPRHVGLGPAQGLSERLWITITRRQRAGAVAARPTPAEPGFELLLLLRWPDRRHAPQPELLQQMLGLTRREAEIGCALLEGLSPREMWTARGLSPATVRSQLRSLYAKTGTRGQVEFVRLVAQLTQGDAPQAAAP